MPDFSASAPQDAQARLEQGIARAESGDLAGAQRDFEALLAQYPELAVAHSNLGALAQLRSDHEAAVTHFTDALSHDPALFEAWYQRGLSQAAQAEWAAALSDYAAASELQPDDFRLLMARAYVQRQLGQDAAAVEDLQRFLETAPESEAPLREQAQQWLQRMQALAQLRPDHSPGEMLREAIEAVQGGDVVSALRWCERALTQSPQDLQALALRADLYHRSGQYERALADLTQALALAPEAPGFYWRQARIFQSMQEPVAAREACELALRHDAASAEAYLIRAQLTEPDSPAAAIADYSRALAYDPLSAEARLGRARLYLLEEQHGPAARDLVEAIADGGDQAEAFDLLREVLQHYDDKVAQQPNSPYPLVERANLRHSIGQDQDALADWNLALRFEPDNALMLTGRGRLRLEVGDFIGAVQDFDRAIERQPKQPELYSDRAQARVQLRQSAEALADLERAQALAPGRAAYAQQRGQLLNLLGRFEEALAALDQAIALVPDEPGAYVVRARAHLALEQLPEAAADYERAIEGAMVPDLCEDCAFTFLALEAPEKALRYFNMALGLNPELSDALIERGKLLVTAGREEEALQDWQRATELAPQDAVPAALAAHWHLKHDAPAQAKRYSILALQRPPDFPLAQFVLGMAAAKLGEPDLARKQLQRFLKNEPENAAQQAEAHSQLEKLGPEAKGGWRSWFGRK